MKNRLQIRYHIPESLPTRAQAMAYLRETFAIGRTNTKNTSLPAEPLVLLYNDTLLDVANGITEAKRLETANVLLAIGRGGDGVNVFNNQDYFVIDFAKHDEEIVDLNQAVDGILDVIAEVKTTIKEMKANITINTNDIANIIKTIGEKGDQSEKDTVYGYIQGAYDAIDNEVNRAKNAELNLQHAITNEATRISNEETRAKQAEADLQAHINTEESSRIEGDEINRDAIIAESERANEAEAELRNDLVNEVNRSQAEETRINNRLNDEIARATSKENALDTKIDETNIRLSEEVARATTAENTLTAKINEETEARKVSDNDLQTQVTELKHNVATEISKVSHNLDIEVSNRQSEDAKLEVKINDNNRHIKENKVSSVGKTIVVTGPTENGTNIEVNVDNKTIVVNESGTLSVSSEALVQYAGENAIDVSEVTGGTKTISLTINEHDKVLTNDAQGLLATLSLNWVHANAEGQKDEIQLIGKDGAIISRIDVADFIKDGILDNVTLNSVDPLNPYLSFIFNSASGKDVINVPVKDLVDIYKAGNGLVLNGGYFAIKIDESSEIFLTVSDSGLKLNGIKEAINTAKSEVVNQLNNEVTTLTTAIANLTNDLNDEVNRRSQADSDIISAYTLADVQLESNYKNADNVIRDEFAAVDAAIRTEFAAADSILEAGYKAGDDTVRGEFAAEDAKIRLEITNANISLTETIRKEILDADNKVREDFAAADENIHKAFADADTIAINNLRDELHAKDDEIETAYKQAINDLEQAYKDADNAINKNVEAINNSVTTLSTKVDQNLIDAKKYTDDKITEVNTTASTIEQSLRNEIAIAQNEIAKINGNVNVDGSIKDIVFDSALGTIVNTITLENATEQSLIKKFTNEGKPYIYVSNNTTDMKHNGDSLNNVLNNIRNDIDETIGATEEIKTNLNTLAEKVSGHDNVISGLQGDIEKLQEDFGQLEDKITNTITNLLAEMQKTIETLQTKLDSVDYNLQEAQSNIQTLQTTAITSIEGVANQIQVDIVDNKAIIGFATDAYFIAG